MGALLALAPDLVRALGPLANNVASLENENEASGL